MSKDALQELRKSLGMGPGELLRSTNGLTGDILSVEGDNVTIGVVSTGEIVTVPKNRLMKK